MTQHVDPRVQRVIELFETLSELDIARLDGFYESAARFKDPFNDVVGVPAIQGIFRHMFKALDGPRFVITDAFAQGNQAMLTWDFHFRMRRFSTQPQVIRGSTHLRFAPDGRISLHRDYWDPAEELYEKLPLIGALMRWLKRRANR